MAKAKDEEGKKEYVWKISSKADARDAIMHTKKATQRCVAHSSDPEGDHLRTAELELCLALQKIRRALKTRMDGLRFQKGGIGEPKRPVYANYKEKIEAAKKAALVANKEENR